MDRPRRHPSYAGPSGLTLLAPFSRIGVPRPLLLRSRSWSPASASRLLCHSGTAQRAGPTVLLRATLAAAHATRPVRAFLPRSGRAAALLGTRRRGRALRRAGLPAAGFAALRLRRFTAPFGRGTGLMLRASALGRSGRARLLALLRRARRTGALRLLRLTGDGKGAGTTAQWRRKNIIPNRKPAAAASEIAVKGCRSIEVLSVSPSEEDASRT